MKIHGKPFPGVELKIVDNADHQLPPGMYGEICVRGITVMDGYYKVPREEVFDAEGWFHTRDAGAVVEDGYLHWTGRLSGLIKSGGANVSPVELEGELAQWGRLRTAMAVGVRRAREREPNSPRRPGRARLPSRRSHSHR
jgi:fatty-acyl-CoA synthase